MAYSLVDPQERQASPPPISAPSAFLWSGLALLSLAAITGVTAMMQAGGDGDGTPIEGLFIAFLLFLSAVTLLFAQARYPFWRKAAGIVELHPLAPVYHRVRDEKEAYLQRGEAFLLLFFIAVALIPRVPAMNHSLAYSELNALEFMKQGFPYAMTHQSGFSNHLLDSLLGNLALQICGLTEGTAAPSAWVVRLPSFLFGVLSVPMLYLAVREALGRQTAIVAALLLAFSPSAVDLSTQARGYSELIFFTIAQAYFLSRALKLTTASAWIGWLVCAVLGIMAHLYFIFVVGLNLIYICLRAVWRSAYFRSYPHANALIEQAFVLTMAWVFLFCVVYSSIGPIMLAEAKLASTNIPVANAFEVMLPLLQLWGGVPQGWWLTVYYITSVILAFSGLWYLVQRPSGAAVYIPLLLLVPFLIVQIVQPPVVYMRFFSFGLPLYLTLLACGITQVTRWLIGESEQRTVPRHAAVLLLAGMFSLLSAPGLRQIILLPKQDYRGAAVALTKEARSETIVGIGAGATLLQKYGVNLVTLDNEEDLRALLRGGNRVLVVDTDLTLNPHVQTPALYRRIQKAAGTPIYVLPGRFRDWQHRWQDGESDIKIYRLTGLDAEVVD